MALADMMASSDIQWEEDPHYFVFNEELPGRMKMHVKRLDLKNWVKIDYTYPEQMSERMRLYQTNLKDIFVTNSSVKTKQCKEELFQLLIEYLPNRFPDIFLQKDGFIYNKVTGSMISTTPNDPEDPLLRIGKLTQEDWIILEYDKEKLGYILTAGLLCFPMSWALEEKYNKVLTDIHEPVKPYLNHLKEKVARLFLKMTSETPYWRSNWGIYAGLKSPTDLFVHPKYDRREKGKFPFKGYETGSEIFLRCEYQTLRKLPKTECIVFSIRTYQRYLQELTQLPLNDSKALLSSIENLDDDYLEYKGGNSWKNATVRYLRLIISDRESKVRTEENSPTQLLFFWFKKGSLFLTFMTLTFVMGRKVYRKWCG